MVSFKCNDNPATSKQNMTKMALLLVKLLQGVLVLEEMKRLKPEEQKFMQKIGYGLLHPDGHDIDEGV